jgi:hypothetical protein
MHHPTEPVYSFTIPSIHDDTPINCRVYHPNVVNEPHPNGAGVTQPWRTRGIVMAHPYAPMGGSYDDRVVGIVVDEFLKAGWIVGTFNFRYALNKHHIYTPHQTNPLKEVPTTPSPAPAGPAGPNSTIILPSPHSSSTTHATCVRIPASSSATRPPRHYKPSHPPQTQDNQRTMLP